MATRKTTPSDLKIKKPRKVRKRAVSPIKSLLALVAVDSPEARAATLASEIHSMVDELVSLVEYSLTRILPTNAEAHQKVLASRIKKLTRARNELTSLSTEADKQDYIVGLLGYSAELVRAGRHTVEEAWKDVIHRSGFIHPEIPELLLREGATEHFEEAIRAHPLVVRSNRKKSPGFEKIPLWAEFAFKGLKAIGLYHRVSDAKGWYGAWMDGNAKRKKAQQPTPPQ